MRVKKSDSRLSFNPDSWHSPVFPMPVHAATHQIVHDIIRGCNVAENLGHQASFAASRNRFEPCRQDDVKVAFLNSLFANDIMFKLCR